MAGRRGRVPLWFPVVHNQHCRYLNLSRVEATKSSQRVDAGKVRIGRRVDETDYTRACNDVDGVGRTWLQLKGGGALGMVKQDERYCRDVVLALPARQEYPARTRVPPANQNQGTPSRTNVLASLRAPQAYFFLENHGTSSFTNR